MISNTKTVIEGKVSYDSPERNKKYGYGFAEQYLIKIDTDRFPYLL